MVETKELERMAMQVRDSARSRDEEAYDLFLVPRFRVQEWRINPAFQQPGERQGVHGPVSLAYLYV